MGLGRQWLYGKCSLLVRRRRSSANLRARIGEKRQRQSRRNRTTRCGNSRARGCSGALRARKPTARPQSRTELCLRRGRLLTMPQEMTIGESLVSALSEVLERDRRVVLIGGGLVGSGPGQA